MLIVAVALGQAKRLVVWLIETLSEALLLGISVAYLFHQSPRMMAMFVFGTLISFMFPTGYLLTTLVLRLAWRNPKPALYSAASAGLFIAHLQVFFLVMGPSSDDKLPTEAAGICIVFACTFLGGWLLRKWVQAGSQRPDLQRGGVPSRAGG